MTGIKLSKLPDRTTVKLSINVTPDLKRALDDYAAVYEAAYGQHENIADLIPFMLNSFLVSDRAFTKARKS